MVGKVEDSKLNKSDRAEADQQSTEQSSMASETAKDTSEVSGGTADKGKVVLEYRGSGIWEDITGKKWENGTELQLTMDEYQDRKDIKWMVAHGEIKLTKV